jgi:glucose-6-phosphate dehydrogenase assembly protein OpcA
VTRTAPETPTTHEPTTHEWSGRGVTVPEVVVALDRLRHENPSNHTRTSVVNLVVVAPNDETAARAASAMRRLGSRHPGRTIVLLPHPERPLGIDAHLSLHEAIADSHWVWWEEVVLEVGGAATSRLDSIVLPLAIPRLPIAVWYPGPLPEPGDPLAGLGDALVVDVRFAEPLGTAEGPTSRAALSALVELCRRHVIVDLSWRRTAPWRELLAGLFDLEELTDYLSGIQRVEVAAQPGPRRLLAGWLESRLHLPPGQIELVDALHASILLQAVGPEGRGSFLVERRGSERFVTATAEVEGRHVLRLQQVLPEHGLTWSLAQALSHLSRDRTYEHALAAALTL